MRFIVVALFPVLLAVALSAQQAAQPAQPPAAGTISKYDRGASQTMLRQVKADLKANYYDPAFRGMDIDKTFEDAEERIQKAATVNEALGIIAEILMRLDDSHTLFVPPDRKAKVTYGWQASMVGDVPFVVDVLPGSDAEKKGLAPGDQLLAWNRFAPSRKNLWQIYYLYNYLRPQELQRLVVRKPDGWEKVLDVQSRLEPRGPSDLSDLILESLLDVMMGAADRDTLVGDTFVWRFASFGDPKNVERTLKRARNAGSMVLDLRGNGGGVVEAMRTMVSRLFDRDVHIGVEKTRKGEKPLGAKGRKDAFTGKLIVLVDSRSGSASEMLARVVQLEKRGTVIGDRTAGAVMTARIFPHLLGTGAIAFYATAITVGDVRMTDGASLEHVGVTPDELLLPTSADLAAKHDPVLARAITILGGTMSAAEAGRLFK